MKYSITRVACSLLIVICAESALTAQAYSRAPRQFSEANSNIVVSWLSGQSASFSSITDSFTDHVLLTGIDQPGAFRILSGFEVLFAGRNSASGKGMVAVAKPGITGQYILVGTHEFSDADIVGITFSSISSRLYALDSKNGAIYWAPYVAGQAPPGAWITLVTATTVPELAAATDKTIGIKVDGIEPQLVLYHSSPRVAYGDRTVITHKLAGAPTISTALGKHGRYAVLRGLLDAGQTSANVYLPTAATVSLIRLDVPGLPSLGSAALASGQQSLMLATPVELGGVYGLKTEIPGVLTVEAIDSIFCGGMQRFGVVDPGPDSTFMPPQFPDLQMPMGVDQKLLAIPLSLRPTKGVTTAPASYVAQLTVGITGQHGIIDIGGGRKLLDSPLNYPVTAEILHDSEGGGAFVMTSIPPDPGLAGTVLLYQWLIADGQTLHVSDVAGVLINTTFFVPPGTEYFYGLSSPLGSSASERLAARARHPTPVRSSVKSAMKWLSSAKDVAKTPRVELGALILKAKKKN